MQKKVLIVEDDKALARALVRVVTAEGYEVSVAHDGLAAIAAVRDEVPGMVLLDLLLPKKDGRSVLGWIRENEATQELPVVVMSAVLKSRSHGAELTEAGAQGYLDKPFRRSELKAVLRRHLGRPQPKAPEPTRKGAVLLSVTPVAELLWGLMKQEFTGSIDFQAGKRSKVLVLKEGTPVLLRSNLAKECLGQRLCSDGLISRDQFDESVRRLRAATGASRQGEILIEMGAITAEQLEGALETQARDKLLELFSWSQGEALAKERAIEIAQATPLADWTPRRLILAGCASMSASLAQQRLEGSEERSIGRGDARLEPGDDEIQPVAQLLAALRRRTPVRELLVDHARSLYALDLIGALDLGTGRGEGDRSEDAAGPENGDEIRERLELASGQNYFEILGVPEGADVDSVRRRFLELAKRFHPDRIRDDAIRKLAADLFGRMSEAHEILVHPKRREAYLESLRTKRADGDGPVTTAIVAAELQFQRGEVLYKKRDYREALRHFKTAVELNDSEGEFHAYYGWTQLLCEPDEPDLQKAATEHLERAIKLAPRSVAGYYFLGLQRKACGDVEMAERMFRRVLEIQPGHVEASREMRLSQMRREKKPADGGLFSFGRKK